MSGSVALLHDDKAQSVAKGKVTQLERRVIEDEGVRDFKIKIQNVSIHRNIKSSKMMAVFSLGTLRTRGPSPGECWEVGRW